MGGSKNFTVIRAEVIQITPDGMLYFNQEGKRRILTEKLKKRDANNDEVLYEKRMFVLRHMKDGKKRLGTAFKGIIHQNILVHMIMIGLLQECKK